jgi:C4-dicarboxylate transporter DctM subunit
VRHLPGGLAIATVLVCAFFASISGSSVATALTIGMLASSQMIAKGYPPKMAFSVLAAGGTLGILIPPSGAMIIYGSLTDTSVLRLFAAGIVPGVILILLFILYIVIVSYKTVERHEPASWEERWRALKTASWSFLIPISLFAGMYSGTFTATEAAAVSVIVTFLVGTLAYKGINRKNVIPILAEAAAGSAMILFIVVGGLLFGHALTLINLPTYVSEVVTGLNLPNYLIVLVMIGILIILGMFLEVISILLITVPVFYPIMLSLGLNPIWIGIIYVIILEMALITPPVGVNLFVMSAVAERQNMAINAFSIGKSTVPFVVAMLLLSLMILIQPQIVLWMPDVIFG